MISFDSPQYVNPNKHFVEVTAKFDIEGNVTPLFMKYNDKNLEIDLITDKRPAASLKSGGAGIRYTCVIMGKKTYLFLEDSRWFFEIQT